MKLANYGTQMGSLVVAAALSIGIAAPSFAQESAKQDMKSAGHDTKNATVDAGHGIAKGTKTGYRKTKNGTKKAVHATGHGLAKVGDKMEGKPSPQ